MPRVQENAPGIRPSRSISRGSRISTITTPSLFAASMACTALRVSISALASSIRDLMPRWMLWGILSYLSLPSFRGDAKHRTTMCNCISENLEFDLFEIPDRSFGPSGMTTGLLPHQFLHRAFQALDRDREHALRKQPADQGGGFRIVPVLLRHRIEPHRMRIGAGDALEPDRSGLFIDMLDRAAGHHDFVGAHRGVADENHLVVVRVFVQH